MLKISKMPKVIRTSKKSLKHLRIRRAEMKYSKSAIFRRLSMDEANLSKLLTN